MRHAAALMLAGALLAACSPAAEERAADQGASPSPTPSPTPALEPSPPFPIDEIQLLGPAGEAVDVPVYVAATPPARQRGLMERDHLPGGTGMVFVWGEEAGGGFWMKDTLLPLSIAFFDADGAVVAVLDMEPCRADPCPVYDPGTTYWAALEVNQGFFDDIGLGPGWRIGLPAALRSQAGMD